MQASLIILGFVLFVCFVFSNWSTPKRPPNRFKSLILPLLLSLGLNAQDTTILNFDHWIETKDKHQEYLLESTIKITEDYVEVRTPYEFYSKRIVAEGISRRTGDRVLFFANCEKMRITESGGKINGIFMHTRNRVTYYGYDPTAKDRSGWSNKWSED